MSSPGLEGTPGFAFIKVPLDHFLFEDGVARMAKPILGTIRREVSVKLYTATTVREEDPRIASQDMRLSCCSNQRVTWRPAAANYRSLIASQ